MNSIGSTNGFLVTDVRGHPVGRVESPMYGTSPDEPDALAVRAGLVFHHRFMVPATAIDAIDETGEMIGLRLDRKQLQRFL